MSKCCKNCAYLNIATIDNQPKNVGSCTAPLPDWAARRFPLGIHNEHRNVIVEEGTTCPVFTPAADVAL